MKGILLKELKLIKKDRRSFIFLLLMPIFFILMYGSIGGGSDSSRIALHVIDQDQSAASKAFIQQLDGIMDVKQDAASSLDTQVLKIKKGQLTEVLVVPKGFGQDLADGKQSELPFYQDASAQTTIAPIQAILNSVANGYREKKLSDTFTALGETGEQAQAALASPIAVKNIQTTSEQLSYLDIIVPGMTVMFVFFIMITMSKRFFEEKKTGLLSRIRSTRIKPMEYLIGMWLPFIFTVIIQCALLFGFGHYVYDLNLGDLSALGLVIVGLSIASTGIGMALCFLAPGESAAMVITQVITMGGALLGGLWMPSYLLPDMMQKIGKFTPQYWAQHSIQDIIVHHAHIADVWGGAAILATFGLIGLFIAFLRLPRFMRAAEN
ncbi:ABC transporter permease [Gorillibacterium massiliense]|uniref:ABC transporter permease n=1 Tax=Gorillibacterium massiliense TaxID=1280390 RepID=UPI0004AE3216|nr:ABC transporter permease [Gorillibacterium massiliense]